MERRIFFFFSDDYRFTGNSQKNGFFGHFEQFRWLISGHVINLGSQKNFLPHIFFQGFTCRKPFVAILSSSPSLNPNGLSEKKTTYVFYDSVFQMVKSKNFDFTQIAAENWKKFIMFHYFACIILCTRKDILRHHTGGRGFRIIVRLG